MHFNDCLCVFLSKAQNSCDVCNVSLVFCTVFNIRLCMIVVIMLMMLMALGESVLLLV